MDNATFETPEGDDIDIDAENVVQVTAGEEEGTTNIELDDGSEIVVVATQLEVAVELGLDPADYLSSDNSEAIEDYEEDDGDGVVAEEG